MTQTFRSFAVAAINLIPNPALRQVLTLCMSGKLNILGSVTLTANSATTTLSDDLISDSSALFFTPRTANAAAGLTALYYNDPTAGSVVLNHANNAQADRTYDYAVIG